MSLDEYINTYMKEHPNEKMNKRLMKKLVKKWDKKYGIRRWKNPDQIMLENSIKQIFKRRLRITRKREG